jgi:hypothetical protein
MFDWFFRSKQICERLPTDHRTKMGNIQSLGFKRHKRQIDGGTCYINSKDNAEIQHVGFHYDKDKVATLIRESKMAPFFRGFDSSIATFHKMTESAIETHKSSRNLPLELCNSHKYRRAFRRSSCHYESGVDCNDSLIVTKVPILHFHPPWTNTFLGREMVSSMTECPICCYYYPKNLNYTCCCHNPICTSCFVQLRKHRRLKHIKCPYCNIETLSIMYCRPLTLLKSNDVSHFSRVNVFPSDIKFTSNESVSKAYYSINDYPRPFFY